MHKNATMEVLTSMVAFYDGLAFAFIRDCGGHNSHRSGNKRKNWGRFHHSFFYVWCRCHYLDNQCIERPFSFC